jgi:hypothetical protein
MKVILALRVIPLISVLGFVGCKSPHKLAQDAPNGATCAAHPYAHLQTSGTNLWYYCNDLGHSPQGGSGECYRTGNPTLQVGFPQNGPYHVNTDIPMNFNLTGLGSGDEIVKTPQGYWAQGGKIDWGDGNGLQNIDLSLATTPLHLTHQYPNAIGSTTIHVLAWAQFKYQGSDPSSGAPVSGSYESCVDATASLTIIP